MRILYNNPEAVKSEPRFERLAKDLQGMLNTAVSHLNAVGLGRAANGVVIIADIDSYHGDIAAYDDRKNELYVYLKPLSSRNKRDIIDILIHELGHRYWNLYVSSIKKSNWHGKYIKVSSQAVELINRQAWSRKFRSYKSFIESFSDNYLRLIALHFSNALIANKVPIELLPTVDFRKHPATTNMATGNKEFSLTPLISMYASKDVYEDFAETFKYYVATRGSLSNVPDSRGRAMLKEIFQRTVF